MKNKKCLGIDFGDQQVGLAYNVGEIIYPCGVIRQYKSLNRLILQLKEITQENEIKLLVFGLPFGINASDTPQVLRIKSIAQRIAQGVEIPFVFQDESFTTFEAQNWLRENEMMHLSHLTDHEVAAIFILKRYLGAQMT